MGAVFLSYRRGDSEGQARALSLELGRLLGKDAVFMDVDSIALGRDFRQVLQERLESCDVLMALIGPGWVEAKDGSGARRLDSPTDFVRQEIAAALKRNIPVIPVLLQGAQIPQPDQLPDDLKDLSYRNGFELGHTTWESDVREMVGRLGLSGPKLAERRVPSPATTDDAPHVSTPAPSVLSHRWRLGAATALFIGLVAILIYGYSSRQDADEPQPEISTSVPSAPLAPSNQTSTPPTDNTSPRPVAVGTTPLSTAAPPVDTLAGSGIAFAWPGEDCWDIYRGAEFVTYQCGTKAQTLSTGRYTIKGKYAPLFLPFDVTISPGAATQVAQGGVLEFSWSGDDCWDIFRGNDFVTYQCGTKRQALGAGRYTIKGKYAPLFIPVAVDIKDGALTRLAFGGVFEFAWPGDDCWDIFRGNDFVTYQCGAKTQALGSGQYTVKGKYAPVFEPFEIKISDGVRFTKSMR